MNGQDSAQVLYMVLLLVLVVSALAAYRIPMGRMARMALIWVAIIGGGYVVARLFGLELH